MENFVVQFRFRSLISGRYLPISRLSYRRFTPISILTHCTCIVYCFIIHANVANIENAFQTFINKKPVTDPLKIHAYYFSYKRQIRSQDSQPPLCRLPKFSTNLCQRSIKFQSSKIWNLISPELKSLSFTKFKMIYKIQLINTYEA